jgi:glycosyltransferase involved in cell wall biosynthesis
LNVDCDIVKIPFAPVDPNRAYGIIKYSIVKYLKVNYILEVLRGFAFHFKTKEYDVIHFDQVLRSFGILSLITLLILSKISGKKFVITVHEWDPMQVKYPNMNKYYNKADLILVYSEDFREELVKYGVSPDKIHVIHYGAAIDPLENLPRNQFIFFGGHKLLTGKGFDTLLNALKILETKGKQTKVKIYVGHGCLGHKEGIKLVSDMKLDSYVEWIDFLYNHYLTEAYQRSLACLIPYTGGSGKYAATCAMANSTPVIATRKAGLPEYLGDLGIYIKENSPEELAAAMIKIMEDDESSKKLRIDLRKKAIEQFSYNVITQQIVDAYHKTLI